MRSPSHALKVRFDLGKFLAGFARAKFLREPLDRVVVLLRVVTPANAMTVAVTKRQYVPGNCSGVVRSRIAQGYPVILNDAKPKTNWTAAYSTTAVPVLPGMYPVIQRPVVRKGKFASATAGLSHLFYQSAFLWRYTQPALEQLRMLLAAFGSSFSLKLVDMRPVSASPIGARLGRTFGMLIPPIFYPNEAPLSIFWIGLPILLNMLPIAFDTYCINAISTVLIFDQIFKGDNSFTSPTATCAKREHFGFRLPQFSAISTRTNTFAPFGTINAKQRYWQIRLAAGTTFLWHRGIDHLRLSLDTLVSKRGPGKATKEALSMGHDSHLFQFHPYFTAISRGVQ